MTESRDSILRTTAALSVGTLLAQALGTASQLCLALWLTPGDFGNFAIANTCLLVLFALVNLGEVSGFLASQGWDPRSLARVTNRFNLILVVVGFVIAAIFWTQGSILLAAMIGLLACEVPLMGRTLVLYAVAVKARQVRLLVGAQVAGALAKLGVGVGIAAATGSPVALVVSLMAYSIVMIIPMELWMRRTYPERRWHSRNSDERPDRTRRLRWGVQSLSQALPSQTDYLVVSVIGSPHVLGIYFFSYQATVGLSTLLSGPLMKSSLAEFGRDSSGAQASAFALAAEICRAVAGAALAAALVVLLLAPWLPTAWEEAGPVLVVLLGSLSSRFITPITEARQVSDGRWTTSSRLNFLDAVGTGLAAVAALSGSPLALAGGVAAWKFVSACARAKTCFREATLPEVARLCFWPIYTLGACAGASLLWDSLVAVAVLILAVGGVAVSGAVSLSRRERSFV